MDESLYWGMIIVVLFFALAGVIIRNKSRASILALMGGLIGIFVTIQLRTDGKIAVAYMTNGTAITQGVTGNIFSFYIIVPAFFTIFCFLIMIWNGLKR